MRPFNCLMADCPIFGPHLLEASAGTGKTFSVEHVIVRLLLESEEIEIEQVLAVTFTRAATRDLKKRIRSNLQEVLSRIRIGKSGWKYLDRFLGSEKAARKLEDAISAFDRCQVFTIHGFCHRMMQEFAFEADLGFTLRDPDREALIPKRIYREARQFIERGIDTDLICPEQMAVLLKKYDTFDSLIDRLIKTKVEKASPPFSVLLEWISALGRPADETELLNAFYSVQSCYKLEVKGDFEKQIKALASIQRDPSGSLRALIREKGSLFAFLHPANKKIKAKAECPPFFEWAGKTIGPLIEKAADLEHILGCLQKAWKRIEEPILSEESFFGPDEILQRMKKALAREPFAEKVREKYRAVIVDEFQDTDPLQWEIFKILFLNDQMPMSALYLVGDPKQSIYRFRNADIYTYYEAKSLLGPSALYCLDTNYRSSSDLIAALNALFDRSWLALPKLGALIPCPSVKAGAASHSDFFDGKGSIHFIGAENFENGSLPYAVQEIERLLPILKSFSSFAILVRDRHQAESALRFLQERSIPAIARSHVPLGKTLAFQSVHELIEAIAFPRDSFLRRIASLGPFGTFPLSASRILLEKEGLISFCREILKGPNEDKAFQRDLKQVVEELLLWEGRFGFSLESLLRFLNEFEELDSDEGGRRRIETDAEAVQILTLHVSKGLEFDVVFALGLATPSPKEDAEDAEVDAEKLRQLYVAMTRAKKRLYVPLPSQELSRKSPMTLFSHIIEVQEGEFIPFLNKIDHITIEILSEKMSLPSLLQTKKNEELSLSSPVPKIFTSYIHSFTSLAQAHGMERTQTEETSLSLYTPHTIPRGVKTGILIHQIFEELFSAPIPLWKELKSVESVISKQVKGTSFDLWEKPIQQMVWNILNLTLPLEKPFSLIKLSPNQLQVEMEFLFAEPPHFVKGFIDLVFLHEGKFYFLDWKTNWLGPNDAAYHFLEDAMTAHDYWLQAKLYAKALKRHVKRFYIQPFEEIFGGALYLFLRGGRAYYFKPDVNDG